MSTRKPPKRLDKICPLVLNAFAANPPDWADEFHAWVRTTLGPRPSSVTRAAASKQYDAALLGAVLAFNYLAIGPADDAVEETSDAEPSPAQPAPVA